VKLSVIALDYDGTIARGEAMKPAVIARMADAIRARYDLSGESTGSAGIRTPAK
jgi:hypothetical protein